MIPGLLVAAPGGIVLGLAFAKLYFLLKRWLGQTLTARVSEFVVTFGVWIIAEHVHVSPILAVVAFAMAAAHYGPERQTARDRVHSYAIWELVVFVLNVLAFLLMGLQARTILGRLERDSYGKRSGSAPLFWPSSSASGSHGSCSAR